MTKLIQLFYKNLLSLQLLFAFISINIGQAVWVLIVGLLMCLVQDQHTPW